MKNKSDYKLSIIIPVFNQVNFTLKCLESISNNTANVNYEVIIVDNASTDDSEYIIKKESDTSNLIYIKNKRNLGFAKACNIGAERAKSKNLVFLNNDTDVLQNWTNEPLKLLEQKEVGIVGSKLLYPDRTIQHAGISFLRKRNSEFGYWPEHINRNFNENDKQVNVEFEAHAVTGACLFIRKDLFEEVGMLSTAYKMYFEDIDLCFKVRRSGKKIVYTPDSTVIHYEGKSGENRKNIDDLNISASKIFFKKWLGDVEKLFTQKRDVVWSAPFFNPSGYASEAIAFALGLEEFVPLRILHDNAHFSENFVENIPQRWRHNLYNLCDHKPFLKNITLPNDTILITHQPAHSFLTNKVFKYQIGRTMFETDSLPPQWVESCNKMDEIWVPSKFNFDTFNKAGVNKNKLFVIPEAIDTQVFDPSKVEKLDLGNDDDFKFLSIFEWTERKGAETLLRSYFEEFTNSDKVCLYLRTYLLSNYDTDTGETINSKINSIIEENKYDKEKLPRFVILSEQLPFNKMLSLYKSVDAFVLPSKGEGWGRPYMEAMAMELPVIATNWSGNTEFMNYENSYLLDYEGLEIIENMEIPFYRGQKWAKPSSKHLKKLMRKVFENPNEAKSVGKIARKNIVEDFSLREVAKIVAERIKKVENILDNREAVKKETLNKINLLNKPSVIWEGDQFRNNSLAHINREITNHLISSNNKISLQLTNSDEWTPNHDDQLSLNLKHYNLFDSSDVHIQHMFPPSFEEPSQGKWVIIQPWEFGSIPKKWKDIFTNKVDEVWVPSNYVKNCYVDSGVPSDKIFVIHNGINPTVFNSEVGEYKLTTKKNFKFLYVGGTIYRKGIDLLLKAYSELFSNNDDVCLVIKDMGGSSFYNGQNFSEKIFEFKKTENNPEIEYIDSFLSEKEITGLYKSCNVLAHPYRGEGFGMPILEAMACGLPAIVTNGGACLDFCNEQNSILVDADKVYYKDRKVGDDETVDYPWLFEPSIEDLKNKMKLVYNNFDLINKLGTRARKDANENFTWQNIASQVEIRIDALFKREEIVRFKKDDVLDKLIYINDLFRKGEYKKIIATSNDEITEYEMNENILSNKKSDYLSLFGFSFLKLNDIQNAKVHFEKALKLLPTSTHACFGLGEVFNSAEMYQESKTMLEWAIINDEDNSNAKIRLGEVNQKLNLPEDHNSLLEQEKVGAENNA
jgi:glycosyltransferase involved in cell wall biosynthesis